jgi:hypothetical protein
MLAGPLLFLEILNEIMSAKTLEHDRILQPTFLAKPACNWGHELAVVVTGTLGQGGLIMKHYEPT